MSERLNLVEAMSRHRFQKANYTEREVVRAFEVLTTLPPDSVRRATADEKVYFLAEGRQRLFRDQPTHVLTLDDWTFYADYHGLPDEGVGFYVETPIEMSYQGTPVRLSEYVDDTDALATAVERYKEVPA